MRNAAARMLAAAVLFALPAAAAADKNDEAAKPPALDGVWDGWVVEGRGENPNRGQIHLQLTIQDNKVTGKKVGGGGPGGDDMGAGTIAIADGEVKHMDATRTAGGGGGGGRRGRGGPGGGAPGGPGGGGGGGGGGGAYKGILAVEGDTLKWCVANPGRDRPTEFATNRGKGQFLMILKKQEPKEKK
jgi:hypothetical protein